MPNSYHEPLHVRHMASPVRESLVERADMEMTVVLTNYMRPGNIPTLIDSLSIQTVRHRLFVWDNSPCETFQDRRADWVIRSSRNAWCAGRWWLASHADTPWTLILDDDLAMKDTAVLADTLAKLSEYSPAVVGATGVILDPMKTYLDCTHVGLDNRRIDADMQVDIIKGRFFAVSRVRLENLGFVTFDGEDDIAVSSRLGGGMVAACLYNRFIDLPTGKESICHRPGHYHAREVARRKWFGSR